MSLKPVPRALVVVTATVFPTSAEEAFAFVVIRWAALANVNVICFDTHFANHTGGGKFIHQRIPFLFQSVCN